MASSLSPSLISRNVSASAEFRLGISTGLATFDPDQPVGLDELLAAAGTAVSHAKNSHSL